MPVGSYKIAACFTLIWKATHAREDHHVTFFQHWAHLFEQACLLTQGNLRPVLPSPRQNSRKWNTHTYTYKMIDTVLLVWRWWCVVGWTNCSRSRSGRKSPSPTNAASAAGISYSPQCSRYHCQIPTCSEYNCDTMSPWWHTAQWPCLKNI